MKPIQVIDAPCGKGKTSWAIQHMNEQQTDRKFIFITPFLEEVDRIKQECKERHFVEPQKINGRTKSKDLKLLLSRGENIVSTHALFSRIDDETIQLLEMGGYTLILDEVMEVVKQESIKKPDIEMLVGQGLIQILEDGTVIAPTGTEYEGRFEDIIQNARMNRLIYVDGTMMIWQFPVSIFEAFEEVYNLTYMFDGQVQKYYYDFHGVEYQYHSVGCGEQGRYKLEPYTPNDDRELRDRLKNDISIHDSSLNSIGNGEHYLSVTWYKNAKPHVLKKVQNNIYNFFRNKTNGNSRDKMWTCFKAQQGKLKGNGYSRGFVPHNARATNKYRHKSDLAYMVNRFPRTPIKRYFQTKGIKIDAERYALSELIQWIWRSRIRDNQPINLYIPSMRMRHLLQGWIGGGSGDACE